MPQVWLNECWRLCGIVFAAALLGWITDKWSAVLLLTLFVYIAWHLVNLYRLERWAQRGGSTAPPEAAGIWGEVFHHVYRLQQRNKKRKKKLIKMLARFQESTSAMPDAAVVLNGYHEIEWFNKAAQELLGLRYKQDIGQHIGNLVRTPAFIKYLSRGEYQEPLHMVSSVKADVQLLINIIAYGKKRKLLLARDITRIQQLESMRRDFIANVSHELKTPITVFNGYLENIIDSNDSFARQWAPALSQMQLQSTRMQHIVDDLLMLSRLEAGKHPEEGVPVAVPVMVAAIYQDAVNLGAAKQLRINLENDENLWLKGNEKELHSAFSNLVSNAVKYTLDEGTITIKWYLRDNLHENKACFEVRDSGIGIAPEHIPRLTERFFRVDSGRSRAQGGTGLGLAIVKHVLLRHGGVLNVDSTPGSGSCFRCEFAGENAIFKPESQAQRG